MLPLLSTRPSRRVPVAAAIGVLLVGLAACGVDSSAGDPAAGASTANSSSAASYPFTIDNCGTKVTFAAAPERVVTIKSSTLEMLLALGLGDTVVATSFSDGPLPTWLAAAATSNVAIAKPLAEKAPGAEAVLDLEPDLVYAGWESNLTAESAGDRATLGTLGVATYVSPSACKDPAYQPHPLTFDDVFAEITEVGAIFNVSDTASELVAAQQAELAAVVPDERGLTALWFSSGSETPYVGAGIGAPQMIMDAAGLTNIAAEVPDTWTSFSWEAVIAADPDVIVLVDSAWGSSEKKIGVLEGNPATATLTAVREHRYVIVPFPASEAGVRNVSAVTDIVAQLGALDLNTTGNAG